MTIAPPLEKNYLPLSQELPIKIEVLSSSPFLKIWLEAQPPCRKAGDAHYDPLPHLNISPSQLMLHRTFRGQLLTYPKFYELHQEWIISADDQKALAKRNEEILTRYNETAKPLPELSIRT